MAPYVYIQGVMTVNNWQKKILTILPVSRL